MQRSADQTKWPTAATVLLSTAVGVLITAAPAAAEGAYPDLSTYRQEPVTSLQMYQQVDRDGVWFASALGLNCSIGEDGSVGCSGELTGVVNGENEIAWFPGDPVPRLYKTDVSRFDVGRWHQILLQETALTYRGTTCAVTREAEVYCIHGDNPDSQFMVSNLGTYRGAGAQ